MRPSPIISSNLALGTQAWRMSCSSLSRAGDPGSSPVARKKWQPSLLRPCALFRYPSLTRIRARSPVSCASSIRASSSGSPDSPGGNPPWGNDQVRRPIG